MRKGSHVILTGSALALIFTLPAMSQHDDLTPKARAKAEVESRHEREHKHTKLKEIGGGTVVGAVAGGVVAGPPGAFAGAKLGHSGGSLFHNLKKRHEVKRQLKADRARHTRTLQRRTAQNRTVHRRSATAG